MKLRTVRGPVAPRGTIEDIEHDAMAAHALMQVVEEIRATGSFFNADAIEYRAGEIMAGWTGAGE